MRAAATSSSTRRTMATTQAEARGSSLRSGVNAVISTHEGTPAEVRMHRGLPVSAAVTIRKESKQAQEAQKRVRESQERKQLRQEEEHELYSKYSSGWSP